MNGTLKQGQLDALVSYMFNGGPSALQHSSLRRVINRGEAAAVPAQWMR
ncbi:MAG: glycoside hydrolase family protein [Rickettsiales bacterium]